MKKKGLNGAAGKDKSIEEKSSALSEKKHEDEALDEALEESFPASDPVAVGITKLQQKR